MELSVHVIQRTESRLVADRCPQRFAPDRPPKAHIPHQPGDCAASGAEAFPPQLTPDLAHAIDPEILLEHAPDLDLQIRVAAEPVGQTGGIGATLLSQTSIGTESYLYTLFLYPGVQYEIDMEASVYTNGLNGVIGATLDPNVSTDTPGYSILFGDGIGNGTGVPTAPEPSTWAMLLIGFATLGFAGYRRSRAA